MNVCETHILTRILVVGSHLLDGVVIVGNSLSIAAVSRELGDRCEEYDSIGWHICEDIVEQ